MRSQGSDSKTCGDSARLGAAVRARRVALRLTQADVAGLAGVGLAFLYDLERGKPTVRLDKVLPVLRTLGLALHVGEGDGLAAVDVGDSGR